MVRFVLGSLRVVLALAMVLTMVSASHAGLFGRRQMTYYYPNYYYYPAYYYPPYSPVAVAAQPVATQRATAAPQAAQPAVTSNGAQAYVAAKPVVVEAPAPAAVAVPQAGYAPAPGGYSGGWSVTPRSSWDYGKFPPFSR